MKQSKKGFTLIELITVIIVIMIVALISTPVILGIIEKTKEKAYKEIVDNIETSANNYSVYNDLGYSPLYKLIELEELKKTGYLENEQIIDPRNNEEMNGCVAYRWLVNEEQYLFVYKETCDIEQLYPEIKINVINDNNKTWMTEYLKFEIENQYDSIRYCIGENNCEYDTNYTKTVTTDKTGEGIYICAAGYYGNEIAKTACTKEYKVDVTKPNLVVNSIKTTSSRIVADAKCTDTISGVSSLQYSINDGAYQNSGAFSNLKSGEYKIKIRCMDVASNQTIKEETKKIIITKPTIIQVSKIPTDNTYQYAQQRVIRITYNITDVDEPEYYFKSTIDASHVTVDTTTASSIEASCGKGSMPGTCTTSNITTLEKDVWYKINKPSIELKYTKEGILYAVTKDAENNSSETASFNIVNMDTSAPSLTLNNITSTTDSITIPYTASDSESGINGTSCVYGTSTSYGNIGTKVGSSCVISKLKQNTTYYFKITTINGSGLATTKTGNIKTSSIITPTIKQTSQTPSGTYAQKRVITITYYPTGITSPKYYYSLDGNTWTEVTGTTKELTFTSNGKVYAKTVDGSGNTKSASAYTVTNIDTSVPGLSVTSTSSTTNSANIIFSASDSQSGIASTTCQYGTSTSYGNNGSVSGSTCSFTGLKSNTTYYYKLVTTNGSGLTATKTGSVVTKTLNAPTIAQSSQTPSGTTYAQKRVIRVQYDKTNITSPEYYFKSSTSNATVPSGVVTHSCGTGTNPGTCTVSSVTTLAANTWYKTSNIAVAITYTSNGWLYAVTKDSSNNQSAQSSYTATNVDTTKPTVSATTSGKVATLTLNDNKQLSGYTVTSTNSQPTSFISVSGTSQTITWEASEYYATYYVWVKDDAGNIGSTTFTLDKSLFSYAATLNRGTYAANINCSGGRTVSGTDCTYYYSNNESQCGCARRNSCQNESACGSTINSCENDSCSCLEYSCTLYAKCNYECSHTDYNACYSCNGGSCSTDNGGEYVHTKYGRHSSCGTETATGSACDNANSRHCSKRASCQNESACGKTINSCENSSCSCASANSCTKTENGYRYYTCNGDDTLNGTICSYNYYTCPNGGTLSGTTCVY